MTESNAVGSRLSLYEACQVVLSQKHHADTWHVRSNQPNMHARWLVCVAGGKSHKPSATIQAAIDAVREQAWAMRTAASGAAGLAKSKTMTASALQHAAHSLPAGTADAYLISASPLTPCQQMRPCHMGALADEVRVLLTDCILTMHLPSSHHHASEFLGRVMPAAAADLQQTHAKCRKTHSGH